MNTKKVDKVITAVVMQQEKSDRCRCLIVGLVVVAEVILMLIFAERMQGN